MDPRARPARAERRIGITARTLEIFTGYINGKTKSGRQNDASGPNLDIYLIDSSRHQRPLIIMRVVGAVG